MQYAVTVAQRKAAANPGGVVDQIVRYAVAGSPTLASDLPTSGSVRYVASISADVVASDDGASAQLPGRSNLLSVDYANGTIGGSIPVTVTATGSPARPARPALIVDAQFDRATGLVRGTISSGDGTTGTVRGRLYGPSAAEIGLSFILTRGDERGVGFLIALK